MPIDSKRKKRRGRRKSKTERLSRSTFVPSSLTNLHTLLSTKTSSREWDAAQSLALQIGTLDARATVVRTILRDHEAPRAAAHYAKRLNIQGKEVLSALCSNDSISPLLVAQFLVELNESMFETKERLEHFVWPWILHSMEKNKHEKTIAKAALHLMLYPPDSNEAKKEQSTRLQRALVTKCLQTGKMCHLVPLYACAFVHETSLKSTNVSELVEETELPSVQKALAVRQQVACRVQTLLTLLWPDVRVILFGSSVTGLFPVFDENDQTSVDVDLCALLPSAAHFRHVTAPVIHEIQEHVSLYFLPNDSKDKLHAVLGARIPIVHFQDPSTALFCDLCVNNLPALWNTRLIRWLLYRAAEAHKLQHVRHLCRWLRKWRQMKKHVVGAAVSSYGLILLAIYYLQRIGLLPCMDCSALVIENASNLRNLTEKDMDKQLEALEKQFVSTQVDEFHDWVALRSGFFRFYTCDFDYENTVVSLRSSVLMSKTSKGWSRPNDARRLCLEDPVETERDLGMLCSRRALNRFRCAVAHAWVILSEKQQESEASEDVERMLLTTWAYEIDDREEEGESHGMVSS
ncbi:hypothetical protein PsorP6_007504 [Peronosclerospora sorghi]|uniref:Uncharacterized protein n=1 Tax=Peronosclerospora sorghi TaxID=230839 RepID=A0ACC0WBG3_9STRA|nr:hypothetical protein PsorP6_007504 [Peronosclerospora sorghi]